MRTLPLSALLALLASLLVSGKCPAGIYIPAEPPVRLAGSYDDLRLKLDDLRAIAAAQPDPAKDHPLRQHYLRRVAELEFFRARGIITVEDRINLAGYYLRLNQPDRAQLVLEAVPEEQRNFLVLANLATAYHLADMADRAILTQQQALAAWPQTWPGYTLAELLWDRSAEKLFLTLLRARKAEGLRPGVLPDDVDNLFGGVKFVGPSAQYEVGQVALEQWDKIPFNGRDLVGQLVLWLPHDNRLYWQMAELTNARGEVYIAAKIMEELTNARQYTPRLLRQHQAMLSDILPAAEVVFSSKAGQDAMAGVLWVATPRADGVGQGLAGAVLEAMRAGVLFPPEAPAPEDPTKRPGKPWIPDIRAALVGLAVGGIVGVLLTLQVQSLRNRRSTASRLTPSSAPPPEQPREQQA